jgi:hypothetical protein
MFELMEQILKYGTNKIKNKKMEQNKYINLDKEENMDGVVWMGLTLYEPKQRDPTNMYLYVNIFGI